MNTKNISHMPRGVGTWLSLAGIGLASIFAARRFLTASRRIFDYKGKVVLITGGSRGFGLAIAEDMGARGARLALCARDAAELKQACVSLRQKGIEAHSFPVDLTSRQELSEFVLRVLGEMGAIDVLINNAGSISVGSFDSFTHEDYEAAMNLMFWGPVNLTCAVLPHMQSRGRGNIVNITSIGGRVSVPHLLPYSCAKFAFVGFSTGLTTELKARGIDVLTVIPGLMRTGSYLNVNFKGASRQEFAWFGLLGNLPGFSVSAAYAATVVSEALLAGKETCIISLPAKILAAIEGLAPDANRAVFTLLNHFVLPHSQSKNSQSGKQLNSSFDKIFKSLTSLGRSAAQRLNES